MGVYFGNRLGIHEKMRPHDGSQILARNFRADKFGWDKNRKWRFEEVILLSDEGLKEESHKYKIVHFGDWDRNITILERHSLT